MNFLKKRLSVRQLLYVIGVQFAGAYFSYLLVVGFWKLGIHSVHSHVLQQDCESDLTVTLLYGSLVEAGGCFTAKLVETFMEGRVSEQLLAVAGALVSGVITVLGGFFLSIFCEPRFYFLSYVCRMMACALFFFE
jgi:glycerol uptake facilitator-like aquaporin